LRKNEKFYFILLLFSVLILTPLKLFSDYPEIHSLSMSDPVFKQLQESIGNFYKIQSKNRIREQGNKLEYPELLIFTYQPRGKFDLFSMAAGLNLPYDTLATINRVKTAEDFQKLARIYIPSLPGIFVPVKPNSTLEDIMYSWRRAERKEYRRITLATGRGKMEFLFYIDDRFHPVERAYFLKILFRFPLPRGIITSPYGERISPFSGHPQFHTGIDIAAPTGTDVYAVRDGIVEETGYSRVYGNYIILRHAGGYETLYGHLSRINVRLNNRVRSGMVIGKVGSTGMATGPHLHFEIRRKGKTTNPVPLFSGMERTEAQ